MCRGRSRAAFRRQSDRERRPAKAAARGWPLQAQAAERSRRAPRIRSPILGWSRSCANLWESTNGCVECKLRVPDLSDHTQTGGEGLLRLSWRPTLCCAGPVGLLDLTILGIYEISW